MTREWHDGSYRWVAAVIVLLLVVVGAPAAVAQETSLRNIDDFACPQDLQTPYRDIDGNVHSHAIECATEFGFVTGTSRNTFSPNRTLTRGQLATLLANVVRFTTEVPEPSDQGFTDIEGNIHEDNINIVAELGIVRGVSATKFEPNRRVTRAQMASFLAQASPLDLPEGSDAFTDDNRNVHQDNINALAGIGVVAGTGNRRYSPGAPVTRGAASSATMRLVDYMIQEGVYRPLTIETELYVALRGENELEGSGEEGAVGTATLLFAGLPDVVCVFLEGFAGVTGDFTGAHVHDGTSSQNGDVILPLPTPDESGFAGRCMKADSANLEHIAETPGDHYVNVHTSNHPDGALRGQLGSVRSDLAADLSGAAERPGPGDPEGSGVAQIWTTSESGVVCFSYAAEGIEDISGAHIHRGSPDEAGPVVVPLRPSDPPSTVGYGCVGGLDAVVVSDVAANPGGHYVNLHTPEFPDGAVRGQLRAA